MRVEIDGGALRYLRTLQQRTTTSLALAVGVTPAAICHIEMGRRASVSSDVYVALVRELGIQARPDWITPPATPSSDSRLPSGIASGILCGVGASNTPAAA